MQIGLCLLLKVVWVCNGGLTRVKRALALNPRLQGLWVDVGGLFDGGGLAVNRFDQGLSL